MKQNQMDKRKVIREHEHLIRPPRLTGEAKRVGIKPVRKPKSDLGMPPGRMHVKKKASRG